MTIEVGFLQIDGGKCPYIEWEKKLDKAIRGTIRVRINRLRLGNYGDCKAIKGFASLYEFRIHLGAGYRVYFGKEKETLIIILCGGDKSTQGRDIEKAGKYWQLYKESLSKGTHGKSKKL